MHIMQMLGIITVVFFIALSLMCYFRDKLNNPIINDLFIVCDTFFLFCWTYAAYELNWLKDGFMTLENISPFICTVIPFTIFLSDKIKEYAYPAIAFLGFGMFLAMFISPEHEYLFNYNDKAQLIHVSEAACHMLMALYGFYLILSDKVTLDLKSLLNGTVFMYASILYGVFLNWAFHRANFGMNMYGDYGIYFLDIFGNFEITLIAYLLGVFATLLLGFISGIALDWLSRRKHPDLLNHKDHTVLKMEEKD